MHVGDVKIVVFKESTKLFHFWIHTAYDPKPAYDAREPGSGVIWENPDPSSDPGGTQMLQLNLEHRHV